MKHILLALSVCVAMASSGVAQELSAEDRKIGVEYLEKTRDAFLHATKDLTPAQWKFKPATNQWSAADIAEHLASTEDFLMTNVVERVMKGAARADGENVKELDQLVMKAVSDRSNKAQAPEALEPVNRFGSPEEAIKHFKESRARTLAFMKENQELRKHVIDSPLGKKLDGFQWLLFTGAHVERHTKQLNELKALPGFPKSHGAQ